MGTITVQMVETKQQQMHMRKAGTFTIAIKTWELIFIMLLLFFLIVSISHDSTMVIMSLFSMNVAKQLARYIAR